MSEDVVVNAHGDRIWYNALGQLHRSDGPALEFADGGCEWWLNGQLHRTDGPAAELPDGTQAFYLNGEMVEPEDVARLTAALRANPDAEAVSMVTEQGTTVWRNRAGQLHRLDGPAVIRANGDCDWFRNGVLHRSDGPAIEWAKATEYWVDGKLHRSDGPAVMDAEGREEFWVRGVQVEPKQLHQTA